MKIILSDDGWINVRDPRSLTEGQMEALEDVQFDILSLPAVKERIAAGGKKAFEDIQDASDDDQMRMVGRDGLKLMRRMRRVVVTTYVESWSYHDTVDEAAVLNTNHRIIQEINNKVGDIIKATGGAHLNTEPTPDATSPIVHSDD